MRISIACCAGRRRVSMETSLKEEVPPIMTGMGSVWLGEAAGREEDRNVSQADG